MIKEENEDLQGEDFDPGRHHSTLQALQHSLHPTTTTFSRLLIIRQTKKFIHETLSKGFCSDLWKWDEYINENIILEEFMLSGVQLYKEKITETSI